MSEWIPLMDYAMKTGVSLSTLRRHIKANKILYRVESGKYLIQLASQNPTQSMAQTSGSDILIELKKAQEEIAELKTLIAFYEESMNSANP